MNINDFNIKEIIGKGAYCDVMLLEKREGEDSGQLYAGKIYEKDICKRFKRAHEHIMNEREILNKVRDDPFLTKIIYSFETDKIFCNVMEYLPVENLCNVFKRRSFVEDEIKFYSSEMILGIEFLHGLGIIHRDLKLENIGLDKEGHIAIMDFGISKIVGLSTNEPRKRTKSICGTPGYQAPEIKQELKEGYDQAVDYWSLGVCLYRMATRYFPFDPEDDLTDDDSDSIFIPPDQASTALVDFIKKLLIFDPEVRLGGGGRGVQELKSHHFYKNVNWTLVKEKRINPPDLSWAARKNQ